MIRATTIRSAIEKPELKVVPQALPAPALPAPKEDGKLAAAILDMSKSAEQNAAMMREAIDKIITTKPETPKRWTFDVIADEDMHSARFGMIKQIIATAENK